MVSSAIFGGIDVVILTVHRRKRSHVCRDKIVSQLSQGAEMYKTYFKT